MILLLIIILIIGLISALGFVLGSVRAVLKWIFTKISIIVPVFMIYSIVSTLTYSTLLGILAGVAAWLILKKLLMNPIVKSAFDICSAGFVVCTLFCVLGAGNADMSVSYVLFYYLIYVLSWAVLSTTNILSNKQQYASELQMSYYLFLVIFAISSIFAFLIIGTRGILNVRMLYYVAWPVRFITSITIAFLTSLGMTKYYISLLGCRMDKIVNSSFTKTTDNGDYQIIKQRLEALKKDVDGCFMNLGCFNSEAQSDIKDIQKTFYSLCSEFQKTKQWSDAQEEQVLQMQAKLNTYINEANCGYNEPESSDINKAMALFMIDDVKDVTEDMLKKQRNVLIKAYHPDSGMDSDVYAQKINDAYSILKSAI